MIDGNSKDLGRSTQKSEDDLEERVRFVVRAQNYSAVGKYGILKIMQCAGGV